jgi:hypothetical protein
MRKFQQIFTVSELATPKGTLILQDYYPTKGKGDAKWREYVLHFAGYIGGQGLVFSNTDARDAWVAQQGVTGVQKSLFV